METKEEFVVPADTNAWYLNESHIQEHIVGKIKFDSNGNLVIHKHEKTHMSELPITNTDV
jgi:hypothetical protein